MEARRILLIAGSDSSGGAGLEADQKVIAAHGCYAMTATTALTAQNTLGVFNIHHVPPPFVVQQMNACFEDVGVDVVKIGMLASAETVDAVADALQHRGPLDCVVDPVMVSTSGVQLLPDKAVTNLRQQILPLARVLTPNIPEARLLLQDAGCHPPEINSMDDMFTIAKCLSAHGPDYILLKGGHSPLASNGSISLEEADRHSVVDLLYCRGEGEAVVFETDYVDSKNTHGTGCSLASAIAANMALLAYSGTQRKDVVPLAVERACRYVELGIRTAPRSLGKGAGPINHFHSMNSPELQDEKKGGSSLTRRIFTARPMSGNPS